MGHAIGGHRARERVPRLVLSVYAVPGRHRRHGTMRGGWRRVARVAKNRGFYGGKDRSALGGLHKKN